MRKLGLILTLAILSVATVHAVELGDTRESVLAELGNPQSRVAAGEREFLNYADGRVEIVDGLVKEFRGVLAGATPPPEVGTAPAELTIPEAPSAPAIEPVVTETRLRTAQWLTSIAQAQVTAKKENKLILALFTGSDWCPPCKQFEAEVAHDEQFAGIFAGSFVFFKNDWLRNSPQPKPVAEEIGRVARKYSITRYPTLMILNADGEKLADVDWTKVRGGTLKEMMIEAIDNARKATKGGEKVSSGWWPF